MTTYLKGFVLIVVAVAIVANALVLKPPCLDKQIVSLPFLYRQKPVKGIKDNNTIFLTALLTSWIAPFTVWMNGWIQTRFLLASFITTFIIHAFGFGVTCLYAFHSNTFKHDFVVVNALAVTFLLISSVSSIWLYWNGSYLFLFHMTKIFCCASPIIHPMFLQERSPDSEVVQTALKSNWKLFFKVDRTTGKRYYDTLNEMYSPESNLLRQRLEELKKESEKCLHSQPLHSALHKNQLELFSFLTFVGADWNAQNDQNEIAFDQFLLLLQNDDGEKKLNQGPTL